MNFYAFGRLSPKKTARIPTVNCLRLCVHLHLMIGQLRIVCLGMFRVRIYRFTLSLDEFELAFEEGILLKHSCNSYKCFYELYIYLSLLSFGLFNNFNPLPIDSSLLQSLNDDFFLRSLNLDLLHRMLRTASY